MKSIVRNPYLYLAFIAGMFLGLVFPFAFIFLDLKQLGLALSFKNMFEVFKSQNIYIFSTVLFPTLFGAISGLYFYISNQNKKMAKQENYIKNVLDSLTDGICVCNSNGKIQYANKRYLNTYETGVQSVGNLFEVSDFSQLGQGQVYELNLPNINGESLFVSYIVYKLLNLSMLNENDQFIVSIRDIQNIKKNEQIIESQKEQLFEASKLSALGEMAAGFAHEINNPLAIIKGRLMITQRGISKNEIDNITILKNLEVCQLTVNRVAKIIVSLKNLAHRTDANHDNDVVKIKNLIEDPITMANMKISGKDINFIVEADGLEEETIVCNSIQISQVLMNFIGNSLDAINEQDKSWVKLSVKVNKTDVMFIISDSGDGIPMDIQKKIFEPMFTTKAIGKGTGLGLSISRSIIEKHMGKIHIDNDVTNTCFVITIPRKKQTVKIAA
jgi:signal transduction histidine kinase